MNTDLKDGWTKQKLIEHVKANFKGKSIDNNMCLYRGPEGKKCVIGLFIPDSETNLLSKIEGEGALTVWHRIDKFVPFKDKYMAYEFQRAHDLLSSESVEEQTQELVDWLEKNVPN